MDNNYIIEMNIITDDFYDTDTYNLLNNDDSSTEIVFKQWRTIVNGLPANYYEQYSSKPTQAERNKWFKSYIDYPTKDISQMPEFL